MMRCSKPGFQPSTMRVRDAETLAPPDKQTARRRALIAARLGDIRLIDNMEAR